MLPTACRQDRQGQPRQRYRAQPRLEINFDVYFFDCNDNRCGVIEFAAGGSNSSASAARIYEWNTTKRDLRVYSKPGKVIRAEQDVVVTRGTTENIDDYLALWPKMIVQFKTFMNLSPAQLLNLAARLACPPGPDQPGTARRAASRRGRRRWRRRRQKPARMNVYV